MIFSYYNASIADFLSDSPSSVIGSLASYHNHDLEKLQRDAWQEQILILQNELKSLRTGHLFFELMIPRMGKRADCVIIYQEYVFVVEFKVWADKFDSYAVDQVHDYALDLKNFHLGSHNVPIVPVLIATNANEYDHSITWSDDGVAFPLLTSQAGIADIIKTITSQQKSSFNLIDVGWWMNQGYQPTPTIIEAAQALYQNHSVEEISRSDAGSKNLHQTARAISDVIEFSKTNNKKSICFVTGVPGAGKTLAGLNIATLRSEFHEDEHAVFLSGNGPLVDVLREALSQDHARKHKVKKSDAQRSVRKFIQNIHHFRDAYVRDSSEPFEKVVVFDEAQRAWTKEQASKFMKTQKGIADFDYSEPEFLISVMDRHQDWCTIVCLIGGGQEINTGEAGLGEWLHAINEKFPYWKVFASTALIDSHSIDDKDVKLLMNTTEANLLEDLHLSISMRSFRAEKLSALIGLMLDGNTKAAKAAYSSLSEKYPIWITRDLDSARKWLKHVARGSERYGLVASSGAHRLRPEGIHIKSRIVPEAWFLFDKSDVRSSYYLEEAATEFEVQGLELDWVGVCWDANLRFTDNCWGGYKFLGSKWINVNNEIRRNYLLNSYRVLLTRARQGMVIFIPNGNDEDSTRLSIYYDGVYSYLSQIGIPTLP